MPKTSRPATEVFAGGKPTSFCPNAADARVLDTIVTLNPAYADMSVTDLFRDGLRAIEELQTIKKLLAAAKLELKPQRRTRRKTRTKRAK